MFSKIHVSSEMLRSSGLDLIVPVHAVNWLWNKGSNKEGESCT